MLQEPLRVLYRPHLSNLDNVFHIAWIKKGLGMFYSFHDLDKIIYPTWGLTPRVLSGRETTRSSQNNTCDMIISLKPNETSGWMRQEWKMLMVKSHVGLDLVSIWLGSNLISSRLSKHDLTLYVHDEISTVQLTELGYMFNFFAE